MTATTKLDLELLQNGAANQTLANETFHQLNQLVQASVVDRATTPPGSPANEALYLIIATATGIWAGKENQLAYWLTSTNAWQYILPREGMLVHVNDEDEYYSYDGAAWAIFSSGGSGVSLPVVQALSSTRNLVLADINTFNVNSTTNNYTVTIPPQSSVAWTADAEIHFLPSNTGDITITGGTGVSVNGVVAGSVTLSTQNGAASIKRIASDSWWVGGVTGTTAEQRAALGLGSGDSPTFTALALSNGQLGFPATQVASSGPNTLDDYEEGTWTPALTFATPGNLSVTYTTQAGFYTKIGRECKISFSVITATFTHTTASGSLTITGMPFMSLSTSGNTSMGGTSWQGITKAGFTDAAALVASSSNNVTVLMSQSGANRAGVVAADMPTGGSVIIQATVVYACA